MSRPHRIEWAYAQLGLPESADVPQIRAAFRGLVRRHHPDVSVEPDAAERFRAITEAYEILIALGPRTRPGAAAPHAPTRVRVEVDLIATARAGQVEVTYQAPTPCAACNERGRAPGSRRCGICRGTAQRPGSAQPCRSCEGTGRALRTCPDCRGRGRHRHEVTRMVSLPAGVRDGERLADGDLLVEVAVHPHPRLQREADDVVIAVSIDPVTAMTGGRIRCTGLSGPLTVHIPPGTQSGDELCLAGQGFPSRIGGAGDARAVIWVAVPAVTDPQAVAALRALGLHHEAAEQRLNAPEGDR